MRFLPLLFWAALFARHVGAQPTLDFNRDIRPVLADNCFRCHGPDAADRQADVRLDVPGGADLAEVLNRIQSTDSGHVMPPPESHKQLTSDEIETLRRWIQAGGAYEQHWAFLPIASDASRGAQIDDWVRLRQQEQGLQPTGRASKRTLARRVHLDLLGLPPTPEQVDQFLADVKAGAYKRMVDRTLENPHFGEHMARYWLDLVRFADTNGLHHDHYREMTPYRDWVIRAFNDNLAFDEFIVHQLAGDLIDSPTEDQLIASGFNRLHLIIDVGTALPEESFHRNVVDRVSAVGTAFLGLTLECAVCHDHKYDPISQRDFYQLYAFFNNFDGQAETGHRGTLDFRRGLQPPYIEFPTAEQQAELERLQARLKELQGQLKNVTSRPSDKENSGQESTPAATDGPAMALEEEIKSTENAIAALRLEIPATLVMKERPEPRPTFIRVRGAYDQMGEPVRRNTPEFLPPLATKADVASRLDLANWLVSEDQPLTARVAVNRFWQQLFGVGLVKTSEDFGAQGEPPSNPQLLDHLASQFILSGWDVKSLLRDIVLSDTYCQSSRIEEEQYAKDPENRLLSRGARYRLDGEVIRDQLFSMSGLLNDQMYGKSVKPPQPVGLWRTVTMPSSNPRSYVADEGSQIYRRSVYTFWKRGLPPPQMTIFDAPTRESCTARRERTNTPLQALVMMNEQQYFHAARQLALQLLRLNGNTDERLAEAHQRITGQLATPDVRAELHDALLQFREHYLDNPSEVETMWMDESDSHRPEDIDSSELSAWTMVVHSLFNLDITKSRY